MTETLRFAEPLDIQFPGFGPEAFSLLEELKAQPNSSTYQRLKTDLNDHVTGPFKRFRDDLVVNWVIPSSLPFETERNVFSRILKNDFGAGGCHHHLWMAFYRTGRKRLSDVQLMYTIRPEGFSVDLFAGAYHVPTLTSVIKNIEDQPSIFRLAVNRLLDRQNYQFSVYTGLGANREKSTTTDPLSVLPTFTKDNSGIRIGLPFSRQTVVERGGMLVSEVLLTVADLWPIYLLWIGEDLNPDSTAE